jgi:two-component system, response regulator
MPKVLLVEDDADFAVLVRRAFLKAGVAVSIAEARDGEGAVSHLKEAKGNLPALVLLDLKLPKLSGIEVLHWIRSSNESSGLRVVVLTSSGEVADRERAINAGADDFTVKPAGFGELVGLVKDLSDRWLTPTKPK